VFFIGIQPFPKLIGYHHPLCMFTSPDFMHLIHIYLKGDPPLFLEAVSCYVAQAGLELGNTPVSATSVFGITNMHHHCLLLNTYCLFAMTNKLQFYHYLAIISLA
jgi:hypothetical protein